MNDMNGQDRQLARRRFLKLLAGLIGAPGILPSVSLAKDRAPVMKAIPSTGEQLPVIGMGTSRTFDAAGDPQILAKLADVLATFFRHGGSLIDSSPMYGAAEQVLGTLLETVDQTNQLFAATKVWTDGKQSGQAQMENSRQLWGIERFDLMQIHNLRDWRVHYQTLAAMKAEERIRYIGITTSHGRFHEELQTILKKYPFDFVQFSYNIGNRDAEQALLPIASERGIAVIVNRPYGRGSLFRKTKGQALPDWAAEFDCASWGQFFLKYVASHPAVTCAIPATSKSHHMVDNMGAGFGRLPDPALRRRMEQHFDAL